MCTAKRNKRHAQQHLGDGVLQNTFLRFFYRARGRRSKTTAGVASWAFFSFGIPLIVRDRMSYVRRRVD